jgi:hypothetical protein
MIRRLATILPLISLPYNLCMQLEAVYAYNHRLSELAAQHWTTVSKFGYRCHERTFVVAKA